MNVAIVIQTLATLAWIIVIGGIVLAVARASRGRDYKGAVSLILIGLVLALLLSSAAAGVVFIQPEERGVVISALQPSGYRPQALEPGLRWIIPFFESVVRYRISRQTYTMSIATSEGQLEGDDSITARTADGQEVKIDASVIYAINPSEVVKVHIEWQGRYTDELVRPLARGVIRDAVSQYGVEEVVTSKRQEMTQLMRDSLAQKLSENGLILVEFILRNIAFSPEYAASVEQKQIAEQQALQARFVVESKKQEAEQARQIAQGVADAAVIRAKGEAESRLIQAEAEAKALLLIADALRDNPELLNYQYISKLAPGIQVMLVPNNAPYLLPLPTLQPVMPETTVVPTPVAPPTSTTP